MADPTGSTDALGPSSAHSAPVEAAPHAPVQTGIWQRIKEHKVVQWTLAYAAAAYTLLHGAEMLSDAQEWPHVLVRVLSLVLVLGVPVVITLAWYHGAKSLRWVSGPELTIITILLFIAGSILWALTRTSGEHATTTGAIPSAKTSTAPRTSIAVMPFANLTGAVRWGAAWSRTEFSVLMAFAYVAPLPLVWDAGFRGWALLPWLSAPLALWANLKIRRLDGPTALLPWTPRIAALGLVYSGLSGLGLALAGG